MSKDPVFPIVNGKYKMDSEPDVRIGVVLSEDKKCDVRFRLPAGKFAIEYNGTTAELPGPSNGFYRVQCLGGDLEVTGPGGDVLFAQVDSVTVYPTDQVKSPKAGDGILLKDVVAGRGFHWQKMADQTLTGSLNFQARDGSIVVVNQLPLEEYLIGVITGEMSGDCPVEFLKSQCVAARSWLLAQTNEKHYGEPFMWCNDDCCQRYQGTGGWSDTAVRAVRESAGEVLITPSNHYCDARYSKNTGGISEDAASVWNETIDGLEAVVDAPKGSKAWEFFPVTEEKIVEYLTGDWLKETDCFASPNVISEDDVVRYLGRVDEKGSYFRWKVVLRQDQLRESLTKRAGVADLNEVVELKPVRRGRSGRLNQLDVVYKSQAGEKKVHRIETEYNIRAGLSMKFLFSGCFLIDHERDQNGMLQSVTLNGGGWGHGAGLCQMGALGRAVKGQKYQEILEAYYQNVRLEKIY